MIIVKTNDQTFGNSQTRKKKNDVHEISFPEVRVLKLNQIPGIKSILCSIYPKKTDLQKARLINLDFLTN
jgi:hypothetical protein